MDIKDHQTFLEIARKTAYYFVRNCWWTDYSDLEHEAYLSLVEFHNKPPPSFDSSHATSRHYIGTVASRHLSRWCFAQSSPASASGRSQRRHRLGKASRVSVHDVGSILMSEIGRTRASCILFDDSGTHYNQNISYNVSNFVGDLEADIFSQEAELLVPRLHEKLRNRLSEIYGLLFSDQSLGMAEACVDVLAENAKSSEAAEDHCVNLRLVYRHTEKLKKQACSDSIICELLVEIQDRREDCHDYT